MKPYILLITLLFSGLGVSVAQQRTRDILFPSFQKDYDALKQKESKLPAPQKSNRSAREQMFTNYNPQTTPARSRTNTLKPVSMGSKNASDISAAEALKTERSKQRDLTAPVIPTQGNETEKSSGSSRPASPVITAPPTRAAAPATVPVRRSFDRKKQ